MQRPDPRIRKITTTTVFINGVQQGPPTVTTSTTQQPQQPPNVVRITSTVPQSWQQHPKIVNAGVPPPTGNAPAPPARKTPAPPPASTGGPGMNPVPAALIRIALGLAGVAFYSALFLFVAMWVSFFYGASAFAASLDGVSTRRYHIGKEKWHNRVGWMWFDGLVAVIKYIFRGGNSNLFMEFIHAVKHPLIRISAQYWRDEFHRL